MNNEKLPYDQIRLSDKVKKTSRKSNSSVGCVVYLTLLCGITWPMIVSWVDNNFSISEAVWLAYIVAIGVVISIPLGINFFLEERLHTKLLSNLRDYGIEIQPELVQTSIGVLYRDHAERYISVTYKFKPLKSKTASYIQDTYGIYCRQAEVNYYQKLINENKMVIVFLRYNEYGLGIRY